MHVSQALEDIEGAFNLNALREGGCVIGLSDDNGVVILAAYELRDAEIDERGLIQAALGQAQDLEEDLIDNIGRKVLQATGLELRCL